MVWPIVIALIVGPAPSPTLAPLPETPAIVVNGNKKHWDPERIVCKDLEEPGSRLATRRVCQSMLQWASGRREDQQLLIQKQYNGAP